MIPMMHYMKKSIKRPDDLPLPEFRTVAINFRISKRDAETLGQLAKVSGVGHTTLARIIVEKYLADHR